MIVDNSLVGSGDHFDDSALAEARHQLVILLGGIRPECRHGASQLLDVFREHPEKLVVVHSGMVPAGGAGRTTVSLKPSAEFNELLAALRAFEAN